MTIVVLVAMGLVAVGLIVMGILGEAHYNSYSPASEPTNISMDDLDNLANTPVSPVAPVLNLSPLTYIKIGLWVLLLVPLLDYLLDLQGSTTAFFIWTFTIAWHELGHFLFMPFGELLMFIGGTFWQVMIFVIVGAYNYYVRRQTVVAMLAIMLAGHSLINASIYIEDAQERELDLILGLSPEHHDWWNILRMLDLLAYDDLIAMIVRVSGTLIVLGVIAAGIFREIRRDPHWLSTRNAEEEDIPLFT